MNEHEQECERWLEEARRLVGTPEWDAFLVRMWAFARTLPEPTELPPGRDFLTIRFLQQINALTRPTTRTANPTMQTPEAKQWFMDHKHWFKSVK